MVDKEKWIKNLGERPEDLKDNDYIWYISNNNKEPKLVQVCSVWWSLHKGITYWQKAKVTPPTPYEPPFEITENKLCEYECRDGSKSVSWGTLDRYEFPVWNERNFKYTVYKDGRYWCKNGDEHPKDLIRKIREL